MPENITALPIYPHLDNLADTFARGGLLLLSAEPGAGKTTLLPWKLLAHPAFAAGKLLLLEPRRLAARAAADRIASLLGEKTGRTVGLRTRLETLVSAATRLEVVTEGVLTRLLQHDPSLTGYQTLLFDEFHTRSLQGDLGLALAWEARKVFRPDLRIAILSATLPAQELQQAFGPWPLLEIPGRAYPVEVQHRPPASAFEKPWEAAARLIQEAVSSLKIQSGGGVLCFLPGYREMNRTRDLLRQRLPELAERIFLLHGQLPPAQQRAVLDPENAAGTRIILATNVAETSLTVPGVKAVVDTGLERRVRFSPRTGMDHWDTMAISQASAEQRKGRAGRTGPGICYRWWPEREIRTPFSPPEINETDLAPLVLETALWGAGSPAELTWLTPPPAAPVKQATTLLQALGLLDAGGKITTDGRAASGLAIHPRLARMVLAARQEKLTETAAVAAALLENEDILPGPDPDFRDRLKAFHTWRQQPARASNPSLMERLGEDVRRILRALGQTSQDTARLDIDPEAAGTLLAMAYPDRIAQKTREDDPVTSRWLLASGRGAILKGPLAREEFLVIADLDGGEQDAKIFLAAPVTRADLEAGAAGRPTTAWSMDWNGWKPKARQEVKLGAVVLKSKTTGLPEPGILQASALTRLREQTLDRLPWNETSRRFLARCRFVARWGQRAGWPDFSMEKLLESATEWLVPFGHWEGGAVWDESALFTALENYLGWDRRKQLDDLAPESLALPSGSRKKLDYESGEVPTLSARLQEFFGCVTTPKICGQPLLLDLLSPAGRTVQLTRDLDGFWDRAYPEIRKDLRGRYPRHYWPDDPRAAVPTARVKPRPRSK